LWQWDATWLTYETLAICGSLELASAVFAVAVAEKPASRLMIGTGREGCSGTQKATGEESVQGYANLNRWRS
jgi:hypothetical protein